MERQLFVVTLQVPSAFGKYFPRVEAERMANIINQLITGLIIFVAIFYIIGLERTPIGNRRFSRRLDMENQHSNNAG